MRLHISEAAIYHFRRHLSFLPVLIALAIIASIWSTLLILKPKQETLDQRVQNVAGQLKCPVCQGESVADSQALIAQQMRQIIREQLEAGKSEPQVLQYFVHSYGDQIVWLPPWQGFSLLAWLVPIAFVLAGIILLSIMLRECKTGIVSTHLSREKLFPHNAEMRQYRAALEAELAAQDVLFRHQRTEEE